MNLMRTEVLPEWVDYNGHMNDAEYARVFSLAVEALMDKLGLDARGRESHGFTLYTLETHLCYRQEVKQGASLDVSMALLDRDPKRLHVYFELFDERDNPVATSEQMLMGIQLNTGQPGPFPPAIDWVINTLPQLEPSQWPKAVGRPIGIRR